MNDSFTIPGIVTFRRLVGENGSIKVEPEFDPSFKDGDTIPTPFGFRLAAQRWNGYSLMTGVLSSTDKYHKLLIPTNTNAYPSAYWDSIKDLDKRLWSKKYFFIDKEGIFSYNTCKESTLSHVNKLFLGPDKIRKLIIFEDFTYEQRQWLRSIQSFLPQEDRFKVTFNKKGFITLTFPEWWMTQIYYKIGWALLAARVANKREPIEGGLKTAFENFRYNTVLSDEKYKLWSGSCNWRSHYKV